MTLETLSDFLLACLAVNYGLLLIWFGAIVGFRGAIQRLHGRWFRLTPTEFDSIHYRGMATFKIGVMLFNLAPWLALQLI